MSEKLYHVAVIENFFFWNIDTRTEWEIEWKLELRIFLASVCRQNEAFWSIKIKFLSTQRHMLHSFSFHSLPDFTVLRCATLLTWQLSISKFECNF